MVENIYSNNLFIHLNFYTTKDRDRFTQWAWIFFSYLMEEETFNNKNKSHFLNSHDAESTAKKRSNKTVCARLTSFTCY